MSWFFLPDAYFAQQPNVHKTIENSENITKLRSSCADIKKKVLAYGDELKRKQIKSQVKANYQVNQKQEEYQAQLIMESPMPDPVKISMLRYLKAYQIYEKHMCQDSQELKKLRSFISRVVAKSLKSAHPIKFMYGKWKRRSVDREVEQKMSLLRQNDEKEMLHELETNGLEFFSRLYSKYHKLGDMQQYRHLNEAKYTTKLVPFSIIDVRRYYLCPKISLEKVNPPCLKCVHC